ncbi:1-(5-phosphoribosyl)-5-[(5-phosphoribosylamino)methylideneamino]imidazole-4-carboxamide isomerase [Deferrisoma camini]|uniref:1-(5-phosphoribosyl)-5-[(5- phosphoribosylamino)methylideneamino]imidazole-4- carboxamide isomerase n=1 Tax=Deferrisoma camini TaxID=1035120 RepID=UPI00046D8B10|nr:1-(5-phosphoribosyl)-5-[(5-phosphoribosylamino)methylideneamino]imidazole-4-carboxamide isomerase [Deferrisoma camini]
MLVIPAIDLKGGRCVRLRQGRMDEATVYGDDPAAVARRWAEAGARRIHVVDLDGAFAGRPENREAIRAIRRAVDVPIELGGGIRDRATAEALFAEGVDYVILGTAALEDPDLVARLAEAHPERVLVGIDARAGRVAVRGWADVTDVAAEDLARDLAGRGAAGFIFTDIERDGMQTGVNLEATAAFARAAGRPVIASGGVSTLRDIERLIPLEAHGVVGVITGRALYEGTLDLAEAIAVAQGPTGDPR